MNSYPFGDSVERFLVVVDAILLNRDRVLVAWDVVFLSHVIQGQLVDAVESILFGRSEPLGGVDGQKVYLPCGPTKGVEARLERRLNDPLEACVPVVETHG